MRYEIKSSDSFSKKEYEELDKIILENLIFNGGRLRNRYVLKTFKASDIIVIAKENDKCIGFVCSSRFVDTLYVRQIAIANDYKQKGVAVNLYKYIKRHSKGFKNLCVYVSKSNIPSQKFYKSLGFEEYEEEATRLLLRVDLENVKNRVDFNTDVKETFEFEEDELEDEIE